MKTSSDRARPRARSPAATTLGLAEPARPVGEEAGEREHEEQLAELGRLELEGADLDPALRAARRLGEREDEQHQHERERVDRPSERGGSDRGRSRARATKPANAEAGGDRLPDDVVALVALDVEARDPGDRPEPVGDERRDREQQEPVEPADEADDVDVLASARREPRGGVVNHSTTTAWTPGPPPGTSARRP